ncbi:hypothetical protein AVEN_182802-1 [Araneus ventricosus]|uniref:Uncharacterized protein n=1 Tax=Araneus ventricosus TaxID=182803 RepID=A0A4Y2HQM7_ARAVE|nr:hypothetical protein AVEN_182802-1 [Araneus ventricosus]
MDGVVRAIFDKCIKMQRLTAANCRSALYLPTEYTELQPFQITGFRSGPVLFPCVVENQRGCSIHVRSISSSPSRIVHLSHQSFMQALKVWAGRGKRGSTAYTLIMFELRRDGRNALKSLD